MLLTDEEKSELINTAPCRYDLVENVIAAYEAKLREQNEPVAWITSDGLVKLLTTISCWTLVQKSEYAGFDTPLYTNPAPIPEGLLDLLAIIHRDGGHYTDEHGIDKAINDAKDKVWAMLAAARSGE